MTQKKNICTNFNVTIKLILYTNSKACKLSSGIKNIQ